MGRKVLVADDEEGILLLVSAVLEPSDQYSVLIARDGDEALAIAQREKPELTLLDIMMPRRDGFEVCRALKKDGTTACTRVVMLSAMVQETDRRRALEAGADAFMSKPFSPTELLETVHNALGL